MFIYNVTIKVNLNIAIDWLTWLKQEHIPEVLATKCFEKATVLKLLEIDESDGPTFAIQYTVASKSLYNLYIQKFAEGLRKKSLDKWNDNFIAFRSFMQIVD